jgi:hypothetical protein
MPGILFDQAVNDRVQELAGQRPEIPAPVAAFLGRLALLHGVPFSYIVPDQNLLPPASLKFFRIDPQWINALLGGALSVGRGATIRVMLDRAMSGVYGSDLLQQARVASAEKRGLPTPKPPAHGRDPERTDSFSGFLLRSHILEGWAGTEVRAYRAKGGQELAMLRLDRITADLLFGLVDGQIGALEITQPPEGLHFEIKRPRYDDPACYRDKARRVLDIASLARGKSGSAQFAHDNIAESLRFTFVIGAPS